MFTTMLLKEIAELKEYVAELEIRLKQARIEQFSARGTGKTLNLIKHANNTGSSIICPRNRNRMNIEGLSKEHGIPCPEILLEHEILDGSCAGLRIKDYLIDDATVFSTSTFNKMTGILESMRANK